VSGRVSGAKEHGGPDPGGRGCRGGPRRASRSRDRERSYLVPPGVDVLELGTIDRPGPHELLPIDEDGKPHWDDVVHVLVTEAQAEEPRGLLLLAYRALCAAIREADELDANITERSRRGETHPVVGMLRLATNDVWATLRRCGTPLVEGELDALHAEVARRVAARLCAHLVN
jgi:hypothetical protein